MGGVLTLISSPVSNCRTGKYADGGGIFNDGSVVLRDSPISNATAGVQEYGKGGGIFNQLGTLMVYDSPITHCAAGSMGGGIKTTGVAKLFGTSFANNYPDDIWGTVTCASSCPAGTYGVGVGQVNEDLGEFDDLATEANYFESCEMFDDASCASCPAGKVGTFEFATSEDDCTLCKEARIRSQALAHSLAHLLTHLLTHSQAARGRCQPQGILSARRV